METLSEIFSCAPDVSPEDVWGDAACLVCEGQGPAVILPPKRVKEVKPEGFDSATNDDGCLRIGTRIPAHSTAETFSKLEVQEIHGDVLRLHPEESGVARMPRHIVFHEKSASLDEFAISGEAPEWGSSKKQKIFWMLGAGVAISALIIGAIMALPFINKPNAARPHSGQPEWVVETMADGQALNDMLARQAEAVSVFRKYTHASSAEEVLPLVREPEAVADLIRVNHRPPHDPADQRPPRIRAWGARENQSLTYGILTGTLPDYSDFETYFTIADGRLVMDWKASTAHGTADFSELAQNRGNPAEIRGWIEPMDFYSQVYPEESFQSYQLCSPDREEIIWVYARLGSDTHERLKALLKGGYILEGRKDPGKVTVRLGPGPADSLPNQWALVELLHKEWITP
jgi:hypothetical protein